MIQFVLTSILLCLPPLLIALWRPRAGRIVYGVLYIAGATFNLTVTRVDPLPLFTWGADNALLPLYGDLLRARVLPHATLFAVAVGGLFELLCAALILSRGRAVKWGLLGAIGFNLAISPLHPGVLAGNLMLVLGEAWLLRFDFAHFPFQRAAATRTVALG